VKEKDSALHVRPGGARMRSGAEIATRASRPRRRTAKEFTEQILQGDRIVLAQAITLVESTRPDDEALALEILDACLPHTGKSTRVGITGVPGAGKSSVIEVLGMHLIRDRGEKVAVLAIDPSSQLSGGSILGDKTRMAMLSAHEMAFIRPSPSRGSLGGVARRTRETMLLCEAAGFQNIIVETVGVGQSETAVRSMVDFFLLLMLAGAGDELQGMKRGVMEMADLVAINKADGANKTRAQQARAETQNALHFFPAAPTGWMPRAVTCSAVTGEGIAELWHEVLEHSALLRANGWFERIRRSQMKQWMCEIIEHTLLIDFRTQPAVRARLAEIERDVMEGRTTSFRGAHELLSLYRNEKP
jgi:LAO/AO transport system kinase